MKKKAKKIKLIILDVDGTLTDGNIIIDDNGVESKSFNVKDGFAIANGIKQGVIFAIITGRTSKVVEKRAIELGINEVYQGIKNKIEILQNLLEKYDINFDEVAYMGDDINDIPALKRAGLKGATYDAVEEVKEIADFITSASGGKGAVREFVEYILREKKLWGKILENYNKL